MCPSDTAGSNAQHVRVTRPESCTIKDLSLTDKPPDHRLTRHRSIHAASAATSSPHTDFVPYGQ